MGFCHACARDETLSPQLVLCGGKSMSYLAVYGHYVAVLSQLQTFSVAPLSSIANFRHMPDAPLYVASDSPTLAKQLSRKAEQGAAGWGKYCADEKCPYSVKVGAVYR